MEDPTTWRRGVFLSSKLSCLSPPSPFQDNTSESTPDSPLPKEKEKEKHLHQILAIPPDPRHRDPTSSPDSPYLESSSPAVTSGLTPPPLPLCALGAAARVIRHETRYTTGGGGCLQSSTSGSRPGTSAYCRTSSSQSQETIAARIVERRTQVGPMYFQGTPHPRCMMLLLGRWLKDGTKSADRRLRGI